MECYHRILSLFVLTVAFTSGYSRHGKTQMLPATIYFELYYTNPWHNAKDGRCELFPYEKGCDVFFKICIWNGTKFSSSNCDVGEQTTRTFEDAQSVSLVGESYLQVSLKKYPPPTIRLRIEAWDEDRISTHDHIVSFVSEEVELDSKAPFTMVNLLKIDRTPNNKEVEIRLSLKLACSVNYYGRLCETYCKSDFKSYACDSKGNRVCYPGFFGSMCNKKDYCFFEPCAPHAQCKNNDDGFGRTCYCGNEDASECYEVRDVCNPSPCLNGGVCQKPSAHSQEFVCQCKGHWYGPTCSSMLSSCNATLNILKLNAMTEGKPISSSANISVCANGGTCVDHPTEFSHFCECLQGWKGETCETPDWTATIATSIFVGAGLLSCGLIIFICNRHRKFNRTINISSLLTPARKIYFSKDFATGPIEFNDDHSNHMDKNVDQQTISSVKECQPSITKSMGLTRQQLANRNDEMQAENNETYDSLGIETGEGYAFKSTPTKLHESEDLYSEPNINSNFNSTIEYRPPLPERSTPNVKRSFFPLPRPSSNERLSKSFRKSLFES
ncbi:hypothetical protein AAHC03_01144 [Spirometra sp. Aus1]